MKFEIVRDIRIFRDMLYPVLMSNIMENNMLLGMLETCIAGKDKQQSEQLFSIVKSNEEIVGAIAQTMPQRPVFSLMSAEVAVFSLENWLKNFGSCNTLFGPETTMNAVLTYLQEKTSDFLPEIERMMSYELTRVKMPAIRPAGAMRFAESEDLELLVEWGIKFTQDCNLPEASSPDFRAVVRKKAHQSIANKTRTIWEIDGKPVSNAIYQRIGYRHACDYLLLKNMNDYCLRI